VLRNTEDAHATPSYVASEALKFLFKKDDEFKRWLEQQVSSDNYKQTEGGVHTKTAQQT
jgi:hypothetical protein